MLVKSKSEQNNVQCGPYDKAYIGLKVGNAQLMLRLYIYVQYAHWKNLLHPQQSCIINHNTYCFLQVPLRWKPPGFPATVRRKWIQRHKKTETSDEIWLHVISICAPHQHDEGGKKCGHQIQNHPGNRSGVFNIFKLRNNRDKPLSRDDSLEVTLISGTAKTRLNAFLIGGVFAPLSVVHSLSRADPVFLPGESAGLGICHRIFHVWNPFVFFLGWTVSVLGLSPLGR